MTYDPRIHHRRSIRLRGYDYAGGGAYFVTICTQDKNLLFGQIVEGNMILTEEGSIVQRIWDTLPQRFGSLVLDTFQMMPNHLHAIFVLPGMDFFDQHVYTFDIETFRKEAEYFGPTRPFTVSEWGARQWGQSQMVMEQMVDLIMDLEAEGKMAGSAFWEWADMRQYGRVEIATLHGTLLEGVVTEARDPRPDVYQELARLFEGSRAAGPASTLPIVLPLKWSPSAPGASFQPIDLQALVESADGAKAWAALETRLAGFWPRTAMAEDQWKRTGKRFTLWQGSDLVIVGVPFRLPLAEGYVRPLLLTPDQPVTIPIDLECERLHILGQVTFPTGYPVVGKRGEVAATYHLRYSGGGERQVPVRNGIEVAQANLIDAATRIDPIATEAQPALKYVKDIVREQYQVLLWTLPLERGKVESLRCEMQGGGPPLAIFAITAER